VPVTSQDAIRLNKLGFKLRLLTWRALSIGPYPAGLMSLNPLKTVDDMATKFSLGGAVHVDSMKPTLKAPGTKRLKQKKYKLLSSFAFKFNVRRYTLASASGLRCYATTWLCSCASLLPAG